MHDANVNLHYVPLYMKYILLQTFSFICAESPTAELTGHVQISHYTITRNYFTKYDTFLSWPNSINQAIAFKHCTCKYEHLHISDTYTVFTLSFKHNALCKDHLTLVPPFSKMLL